MFCPSCGKAINKKSTVCPNCNEKLQIIDGEFQILKEEEIETEQSGNFFQSDIEPENIDPQPIAPNAKYAGFFIRATAFLIDCLIIIVINRLIGRDNPYNTTSIHVVNGGMGVFIAWLYYASLESSKLQATLGKLICGLNVTDYSYNRINFIKATLRHFSKYLSVLIIGIGYFMVLFTGKKQALHDKLASTYVIKVK